MYEILESWPWEMRMTCAQRAKYNHDDMTEEISIWGLNGRMVESFLSAWGRLSQILHFEREFFWGSGK